MLFVLLGTEAIREAYSGGCLRQQTGKEGLASVALLLFLDWKRRKQTKQKKMNGEEECEMF